MINDIKKAMEREGIDVFGTSDCSTVLPEKFSSVPYAVTLGIRLSDAVVDEVSSSGPTKMYFAHYRSVNALLDSCALKCVIMLQRSGYRALAIPASQTVNSAAIAGDFQHKTAANLAGLGFIGKSGLFVTLKYGPRVRFVTVLTDMPLKSTDMVEPQCGHCSLCVTACPCGALTGREWTTGTKREDIVDADLCSYHMKDKFQRIGRGSVCGICMAVCPFGTNK